MPSEKPPQRKVFVSGCYDILHAGHLEFFRQSKALGDYLTVSFASSDVLWIHKRRRPSIPDEHKKALIEALDMVDQVVIGTSLELGLDFKADFMRIRPQILAVTTDDKYENLKRDLCAQVDCEYVVISKTGPPVGSPISTTEIIQRIRAPDCLPLRVDFAGGWLDVPKYSRAGAYIVNCAISPVVSLKDWPYERHSGLGGSAAWAILNGLNGVTSELEMGVGWQDPAIVTETGLCVWKSGDRPLLDIKTSGEFLSGKMAIYWTGEQHDTPSNVGIARDYDKIEKAGCLAREAVWKQDIQMLSLAVNMSYMLQLEEGMKSLDLSSYMPLALKYCGGGHGGYCLLIFQELQQRDHFCKYVNGARPVEPFIRS